MKCYKRIITLFLAFAMLVSMLTFASAAGSSGVLEDSASVAAWNSLIAGSLKNGASASSAQNAFWRNRNQVLSNAGIGELETYAQLTKATSALNRSSGGLVQQLVDFIADALCSLFSSPDYLVMYDSNFGCYRPYDNRTGLWVVNSMGHFPYYPVGEPTGSINPAPDLSYQWRTTGQSTWNAGLAIVSYMELKEILALGYDGIIERRGNYLHIFDRSGDGTQVLCTEEGFPLSVIADMSSTAVGTPNNYYTEEGDTINNYDQGDTIYNEFLDITNNTTWFPNGTLQYIDKVVYDESTKTYIVDSHDSYTYNSTTNNYVTNNYRYEYNFHIDYTSVTYIGTTEQYDEEYRYYYQLPDGRSSADLTAEDLEQLSIAFVDVVNYARSADDANMRALYHFDGNTQDSSYWSYCTDFTWNTGASLTYMDEGTFGGSLYLDETEHDFTITLPNNMDGLNDFTFQFRYYQSYTAAPVTDSYIKLGDNHVLWFSGSEYKSGSTGGTSIAQTSIGTWNEIALICSGGALYYYVNGVPYTSVSGGKFSGGTITFHFGAEQQTYKKLDELRFSRGAIYTPGENYEPTAVPHDTNLTLILPDGERPIADEISVFVSPNNLLTSIGMDDWRNPDIMENFTPYIKPDINSTAHNFQLYNDGICMTYDPSYTTVSFSEIGSFSVSGRDVNGAYTGGSYMGYSRHYSAVGNGLFIPTGYSVNNNYYINPDFKQGASYCLSVVLPDGSVESCVFYINSRAGDLEIKSSVFKTLVFSRCMCVSYVAYGASNSLQYGVLIQAVSANSPVEVVYMELVEGTEPQFEITYETAMYSSGELEDSPVLAVRSNQTITGYQIGGVRPSYPAKGQVWAMVENGRITSLQQYSGSAWIEVDGRIWTGQRWIPYSSFDVFLLKDCYDIQGTVTGDDYEYIYSESGFWAWWQKQWLGFKDGLFGKLDAIIAALEELTGLEISDEAGCQHVFTMEVYDPTCSDPGHTLYTCTECGYGFTEPIDALGHDWIVEEDVPNVYEMPDGAHCPGCSGTDFTFVINANQDKYTCTCTVCSVEWSETPEVTYGYTLSTCSRCGKTQKDSKDPESGLFDALGNFLADGVEWVTDKLTQAVNGLNEMLSLFRDYAESMKDKVGQYPAFLAAVLTVFPQDLMDVFWFGLLAVVVVFVWKKVFS